MHHIPVETIIWVVLLVIGVISSVVKKAREGTGAVSRMRQRVASEHSVVASVMGQPAVAPPAPVPEIPPAPAATPPIVIRPRRAPAAPLREPALASEPLHGQRAFRGMFERDNLVRAIVAAEVLGPPKALQEQSIWSPPHSEPSI